MKQHLYKGRGAPNFTPTSYSQLYLDLDTNQHWIAFGIDSVADWAGPYVTQTDLENALTEFAAGLGDGQTKAIQRENVEMHEFRGRSVTIVPNNRNAVMYVVDDPDELTLEYDAWIDPQIALDRGTEIILFNNTPAPMSLRHDSDVFHYAGGFPAGQAFPSKAVITLKLLGATLNTRYWLVWMISGTINQITDGGGEEDGSTVVTHPAIHTVNYPGMNANITIFEEEFAQPFVLYILNDDFPSGGWYNINLILERNYAIDETYAPQDFEFRVVNHSPKACNLAISEGYGTIRFVWGGEFTFIKPFGSVTLKVIEINNGDPLLLCWGDLTSDAVQPM